MIMQLFSIYDSASGLFGRPMFMVSRGQAVRSFTDEVNRNDPQNDLYKHPSDFTLYHLGAFDDADGSFNLVKPDAVIRGVDASLSTKEQ
ncbi:MAG: nonstructural protein [Microviridae sp.]|nr:MAG: nonstructural protein [Microviridae sp.]